MNFAAELLDELAGVYVEAALRRLESEMASESESVRSDSPEEHHEGKIAERTN